MPHVLSRLLRTYISEYSAAWETLYIDRLNAYVPHNAPHNCNTIVTLNHLLSPINKYKFCFVIIIYIVIIYIAVQILLLFFVVFFNNNNNNNNK